MEKENFKNIEFLIKIISLIFGLSFVLGFFIWNVFLYRLGFTEDKIFQTRFILTGFCFLFIFTTCFFILEFLIRIVKKIQIVENIFSFFNHVFGKWPKIFKIPYFSFFLLILICFILLIILYVYYVFPYMPMAIGGGQPRVISVLGSEEQINYLGPLGISTGEGSSIQTENMCLAYENDDSIIILRKDRIVSLQKQYIKGFNSLSTTITFPLRKECSHLAKYWIEYKKIYYKL